MANYYNWHETLSRAADVTIVVTARGRGKTYGLRKHCIKDYLKRGGRFVELCRFKSELGLVSDGYFDRVSNEFPEYIFKTDKRRGYIAEKPEDDENKPEWKTICYFIAMTDSQNAKKRTYNDVTNIIFDEAILERHDVYHRYLPREYSVLANIVDTVTRERADVESARPHLYLLGNAVDLLNPYFEAYQINKKPRYGFSWYRNKTVLLHFEDPGQYAQDKLHGTLSGRMIAGTAEGAISAGNVFEEFGTDMITKKTKNSDFLFGIIAKNKTYGIWADDEFIYVSRKIPANTNKQIYYMTREDASVNRLAANKAVGPLRAIEEANYANIIRYESMRILNEFHDIMKSFGFLA